MANFQNSSVLSFLTTVKYTHAQTETYDYSSSPRPCHNIAFFLKGKGEIISNGKKISLQKGDIFYIPQNTTYQSIWEGDKSESTIYQTVHFNFTPQTDPLSSFSIPVQKIEGVDFETTYRLVQAIERFQNEKNADYFLALSAFFHLLGEIFQRAAYFEKEQTENPVLPAIRYIKTHVKEKISVETLASVCFLSQSRFFYLFKKHTGLTPIAYKNKEAILQACTILLTKPNKTTEDLADEFGFENAIYFRRLFKKLTGKTPTEYKKKERLA